MTANTLPPPPGPLPPAGGLGGRRAALYGRCPWQGLCLLPAARRRAAWGAGAAARRQLPWPIPPRRTSCRCPVSGCRSLTWDGAAGRVAGPRPRGAGGGGVLRGGHHRRPNGRLPASACGRGPWSLRSALRGRSGLPPAGECRCPGARRRAAGPPSSGVWGEIRALTSEIRRRQPCCRHRRGAVVRR